MYFEDCRNNSDRDKFGLCTAGLSKCKPDCVFYMKVNKPTNADRIRGMNDEELANLLWEQNGSNRYWKSVQKYLDWLKAETEGTE